ncbi:MAG: flavodoxin domain-containing protein [Solirubrobacterales bacterium]
MRVLIAYASRHGATAGIAARIADRMADRGVVPDVRRVDAIEEVGDYDAIVLGSPVYDGAWPPEARRFVSLQAEALAARPLWLFSVGSLGDTGRLLGPLAHKEPRDIDSLRATLLPRDYRVFRGVIEKHQWPFWSRLLFHLLGGRLGDHREWSVIDRWADEIARAVSSLPDRASS